MDDIYDLRALNSAEAFAEATGVIKRQAEGYSAALQGWRYNTIHDIVARYGAQGRGDDAAFTDSSRIIMPTEDKYVGRHRAYYGSAFLDHDQMCAVRGLDPEGKRNEENVALYMEALLSGRDPCYSIQGFDRTFIHGLDDVLTAGFCGFHVEHETRREPLAARTVTKADLPAVLQMLIVGDFKNDKQRQAVADAYLERGTDINPTLVLETFGAPVNPMDKATFDEHAGVVEMLLRQHLELDDQATDRRALGTLMRWMRAGGHMSEEPEVDILTSVTTRQSLRVDNIYPENLILPTGCSDPSLAQSVSVIREIYDHELVGLAQNSGWNDEAVDKVLSGPAPVQPQSPLLASGLGSLWSFRRWRLTGSLGSTDTTHEARLVATTYAWVDLDRPDECTSYKANSAMERVRMDWSVQDGTVLNFVRHKSRLARWPVHAMRFDESSGPLIGARGLPRLIRDPSMAINTMHRGRHDQIAMMASFQGVVRRQTVPTQDGAWKMKHGTFVEVDDVDDIKFAGWPTTTPAFMERDELMTQQWVEDYVGEVSSRRNRGNADEAATATQIRAEEAKAQPLITGRMGFMIRDAKALCNTILVSAMENLPADHWTMVTGQGEQSFRSIDLKGRYNVAMSARPEDANPGVKREQAMQLFQLAAMFNEKFGDHPKYVCDDAEAMVMAMRAIGLSESREVVRLASPEEQQRRREALEQKRAYQAELGKIVEKMRHNISVNPQEFMTAVAELDRKAPHRGWQAVEQGAKQAEADAIRKLESTGGAASGQSA